MDSYKTLEGLRNSQLVFSGGKIVQVQDREEVECLPWANSIRNWSEKVILPSKKEFFDFTNPGKSS